MRDGQEGEKRRGNRDPERRRRAGRGGDSPRGLNGRAYARGPGQTRARLTTRQKALGTATRVGHNCPGVSTRTNNWTSRWTIYGRLFILRGQLLGRRWRCDVERARYSTRAQGPSHMSDIPDHREDDKVVQEGCSRWTTRSERQRQRREPRGTPLARETNTCGQ